MVRKVLFATALAALFLLPAHGEETKVDAAKKALDQAESRLLTLKQQMAARFMAVKQDFELVRSRDWAGLSQPYLAAIKAGGKDLEDSFVKPGILSETVARRAARAAQGILEKAKKEGKPADPVAVLAAALKDVFPADDIHDCWDQAFQDLPLVVEWRKAQEQVAAAKKTLAAAEQAASGGPTEPPDMILIPKGRFQFGPWVGWSFDLKHNRQSKIRLNAYYIDRHEVTNGAYRDFVASLKNRQEKEDCLAEGYRLLEDGTVVIPEGTENHPARGMTLMAAAKYAEAAGKRLPTEEEWEKAARGEDGRTWPWGKEFLKEATNWKGRGLGRPTDVGACPKDVSPFGVLDMAGNVSELTATLNERREYKHGRTKLKPTDTVMFRGGNYEDGEESTKATYRWPMPAVSGQESKVGFRCVITERDWKRQHK